MIEIIRQSGESDESLRKRYNKRLEGNRKEIKHLLMECEVTVCDYLEVALENEAVFLTRRLMDLRDRLRKVIKNEF